MVSLDLNKIHVMVEDTEGLPWCSCLSGDSISAMPLYDGITTQTFRRPWFVQHRISFLLTTQTISLGSQTSPVWLRKPIYHKYESWSLATQIEYGIKHGAYDPAIIQYYDAEEIAELGSYIDHDRDMKFTYAGLRQVYDKYLCQDRSSGKIYETPQFMYMLIAMTIFNAMTKMSDSSYVKRYYDLPQATSSTSHASIMAGVLGHRSSA